MSEDPAKAEGWPARTQGSGKQKVGDEAASEQHKNLKIDNARHPHGPLRHLNLSTRANSTTHA